MLSQSREYVSNFIKFEKLNPSDLIEIHNRPNYLKLLNKKLLIHEAVKEKIISYEWPGNVFQIMNITENIVKNIDVTKDIITTSDVDLYINDTQNDNNLYNLNYKDAKDSFEREYLMNKLKLNSWNVTKTALSLNLDRVSLYRKIKSLKINLTE